MIQRRNESILAVSLAVGLAAVGLLCWRFGFDDLARACAQVRPGYVAAYLGLAVAVTVGYSLRWYVVAAALGPSPGLARFVGARLAGDAVGSLLPTGRISGDPLRVALLYADGVGGARAGAGVAIDRVLEVVGNLLCVVAYVTVFSLVHTLGAARRAPLVLIATMLLLLVLLVIPVEMLRRGQRPITPLCGRALQRRFPWLRDGIAVLRRTEDHLMRFFGDHPLTVVCGVLGSLLIEALVIVEYHCLLAGFGLALDLPLLLMVLVAGGLARVVPTPAGLGTLEASQVTLLALASGRPDLGFVVGMVLRLHETVWTAVGLAALSAQGFSIARLRLLASTGKAG